MTNRISPYGEENSGLPSCAVIVIANEVPSDGGTDCYYEAAIHITQTAGECRLLMAKAFEQAQLLHSVSHLTQWDAEEISDDLHKALQKHLYFSQKALVKELRSLAILSDTD
jgi:hypothetical protein